MLFNTLQFAGFFIATFSLYWTIPHRFRKLLLLVASYVFYSAWDYRFLLLIVVSTVVDYSIGLRMERTDHERTRKSYLALSAATNMGILFVFKYLGFFVESAVSLLKSVGLDAHVATLRIILPVGISFYSFQTLSYTFDVFRRRIDPTRSLLTFAVYVAFFPQLVAGPIERARHLLPQLEKSPQSLERVALQDGLALVLIGLFQKVAIADTLAPIADYAFGHESIASSIALMAGIYAFALQIYGDFAGYSNMARGLAKLLGVELVVNFRQPYLARNIGEFWRTWHISLSNWLHDYLYIPLGGNRAGVARTYRNLFLTMLIGGLWHGAAWTFVVWGALHGSALAAHRAFGRYVPRDFRAPKTRPRDLPAVVGTFHVVCLGWVFFRADSVSSAVQMISGVVSFRSGSVPQGDLLVVGFVALLVIAMDVAQRNLAAEIPTMRLSAFGRGLVYGTMVTGIIIASGEAVQTFIYFQF